MRGHRGGAGNGGPGRYVDALPPVLALIVPGQEDVEHDTEGDPIAPPDVFGKFPQGGATEAY